MKSYQKSDALMVRALKVIPDATQTYSKGPGMYPRGAAPFAISQGRGATVWDVDGNQFTDWTASLCAVSLGHSNGAVSDAVWDRLARGTVFGLPWEGETEISEWFLGLTGYDMVRWAKNGSDATSAAVRLARAVTGRNRVIRFRGHYHGCADWAQQGNERCAGVWWPDSSIVDGLANIRIDQPLWDDGSNAWAGIIACIICDPLMFATAVRKEALQELRDWCDKRGALLIFDEVIAGFRLAYGGAGELYGVRPDLACFGKAIANGVPLACLAGKREYMEQIGKCFISYTYGGDTLGLAACGAVMHEYQELDVLARLKSIHDRLAAGWKDLADERLSITADGTRITFRWEDTIARSIFIQECLEAGLLTNGQFVPMSAHAGGEVQTCIDTVREIVAGVKAGRYELMGKPITAAGVRR